MADLLEDYNALRHGCAVFERRAHGRLALGGADRQRFLNSQVTCDVKLLAPGTGAYGFFTTPQGKIVADVTILAREDELWLELPPGKDGEIAERLRKFIITDQVEVRPLADLVALGVAGPGAAAALESLGAELPEDLWSHRPVSAPEPEPESALGTGAVLVRQGLLGVPAWALWVPADQADPLAQRLLALPGVRRVEAAALEILRAEAGLPLYGRDFSGENFPQETGLEEQAVSYTKGCYLGQEVIARIHYRGGVHKGLSGIAFPAGAAVPEVGARLSFEGKEVGTLTTAVGSPALGRPIGLAILNKKAAEPGTRLAVSSAAGTPEGAGEGGGQAEVVPLPFVPAA